LAPAANAPPLDLEKRLSEHDDRIPFHRPSITEREVEAAVEVLRSGWLTTGPKVHELEAAISQRIGAKHALAMNSATAALHLALEAWGVGEGDDVVIPTTTFTSCGEVCAYLGARVVLADVGQDGLLGPEQLAAAVTNATRAVMPVHLAGTGVDVGALRAVAPGVRFLEDAAHAFPATVNGVPVGRLGDAAALSFYATKTMTTGGEGGMLVTNDDSVAARVRVMRLHGISSDAWNRYGAGGTWAYEVAEAGFKYNLTDLAAAIGLAQLERLDELRDARAAIAALYDTAFADSPLIEVPPRRQDDLHAWHLYVVRLSLEALSVDRATVIQRMADAGIGTSVHFIPLHLQPYYQRTFGYKQGDLPTAERLFERSLSLPIWPGMTSEQVDRVAATLLEILTK
jgi:perosamine synthetase